MIVAVGYQQQLVCPARVCTRKLRFDGKADDQPSNLRLLFFGICFVCSYIFKQTPMIQMSRPRPQKSHRTWAVCPSPLVAMAHCRGNLQAVPPWSMALMAVQVCCGCCGRDIFVHQKRWNVATEKGWTQKPLDTLKAWLILDTLHNFLA